MDELGSKAGTFHQRERFLVGRIFLAGFCCVAFLLAQERRVDPTFLHRSLFATKERPADITTQSCHYFPLFGEGDSDARVVVGIARYGEVILDPKGSCTTRAYPEEDQVYVVLEGAGALMYAREEVQLKKEDYLYIPATVPHSLTNPSRSQCKLIVMGFRTRGFEKAPIPAHALEANIEDVPTQPVSGHPSSTLYRLLMGDVDSKRDRIAAGRVLTSLFVMEIAPGGTNFPHHHEREEEIYLLLDGSGEIVAGGGMDGIEGRHAAKAGDAYFFRLNCTVGYYSAPGVKSRVLAVRSWYPGMVKKGMEH
ncbi:MAG: cupin domain-containing protein [Acidobacteriaceae bacterium]|nr:cupin domain-containing protein [Acidobacteriaceae bacterium]MBV9779520.1 cupin domain-containing protein [Acidobacteriaceae bacterium]